MRLFSRNLPIIEHSADIKKFDSLNENAPMGKVHWRINSAKNYRFFFSIIVLRIVFNLFMALL